MWKVTALNADGSRSEVQVVELKGPTPTAGPVFSSKAFLEQAARLRPGREQWFSLIKAESEFDFPIEFQAIESYAEKAAHESKEYDWTGVPRIERVEEMGIARFADAKSDKPECVAWHDRTGVLIPITGKELELWIEYEPDGENIRRAKQMQFRQGGPDHVEELIFDWRAYAGKHTAVVDGWTRLRQAGKRFVANFSVSGPCILIGTALRRLSGAKEDLPRDPLREYRLTKASEKWPALVMDFPSLEHVEFERHDAAMVFVHGTASCGPIGMKDLVLDEQVEKRAKVSPCYRFEHDTFLPVAQNSELLTEFIMTKLEVKRLLLVGHSRGGLVSVDAAKQLKDRGYGAEVTIFTFGTPFRGTPLVDIGAGALNLIMKLGEEIATSVPIPYVGPLAKAAFYLIESPGLPNGIADMSESATNGQLIHFRRAAAGVNLKCWGGDFNIESGKPGFGVAVDGVLVGAMGRRPHDLVVPLVSAIAYGESQPLLRCPHNRYFLETSVRHAISAFFAPASDRPSVATAGPIKVLAPIVMKKAPPVPTTRPKSPRTQKSAGT